MSAAPTDEIYERYLQKAISEINELGDEIGRAGDELHVPVLGSGHPLADVFLLKYEPRPSEVQEGVAFYGRSGQALLKSLQRLRVDPLAVYGTNCLKLAGQDPEEARPWLVRELHIVQPKLLVVMGEQALAFLNALAFPLSGSARRERGRPPALHGHDRGARRSRHRRRASTRRRRRPPSGTPSRRSGPGSPSSRPTEPRRAGWRSRASRSGSRRTAPAPGCSGRAGSPRTSRSSSPCSSPRRRR